MKLFPIVLQLSTAEDGFRKVVLRSGEHVLVLNPAQVKVDGGKSMLSFQPDDEREGAAPSDQCECMYAVSLLLGQPIVHWLWSPDEADIERLTNVALRVEFEQIAQAIKYAPNATEVTLEATLLHFIADVPKDIAGALVDPADLVEEPSELDLKLKAAAAAGEQPSNPFVDHTQWPLDYVPTDPPLTDDDRAFLIRMETVYRVTMPKQ